MKNKLTVAILTYNSEKTILNCLKSLESQKNKNFEILIIDDDSTDNTLNIVNSFFSKNKTKFKVLRNGTHNIPRGRNIAIKECKTQYLAFLDSDEYADKNWIERILNRFNEDKSLVVIGGEISTVITNDLSYANALSYDTIRKFTRKGFWKMGGGNSAFNLKHMKGEYFNENFKYCEDMEFFSRLKCKYKFKYDSLIKISHEHRDTLKRYIKQQYNYSIWELFFNFSKNKEIRFLSFIPSILIIGSVFLAFFNLWLLLIIPFLSLFFSVFVWIYKRSSIKILPFLFVSFFFKILGFGLGTIKGLTEILFKSRRYRRILK